MTFRLLMFGRSGQVARETCLLSGKDIEVIALGRDAADFRDSAGCAAQVEAHGADAVLIAAAYTAVDKAESESGLARTVNAQTPGEIANAAARRNIPVVHLSTDYVFDGEAQRPYREEDAPNPLSVYGATKLEGERNVLGAGGVAAVLRTSWVFAGHGRNFVATMLRLGRERPSLSIVDDQIGGPTPAGAIARAAVTIAQTLAQGRAGSGLVHYQGAPAVSWAGFAAAIFETAAGKGAPRPVIRPIATRDYPLPARRPLRTVLDCTRAMKRFGLAQPDWRGALGEAVTRLGASQ